MDSLDAQGPGADASQIPVTGGYTSATPLDGNMEYGIGWGVAFVEALKDAGRNFTRASFLKILNSTSFTQTPALLPLSYSSTDHQGLDGGYITTVTSATSVSPITGTIYQTDSTSGGAITIATKKSSGIPAWLK